MKPLPVTTLLFLSTLLLGAGARSQNLLPAGHPFLTHPGLQAAGRANAHVVRSECTWQRVIRFPRTPAEIERSIADHRKQRQASNLAPDLIAQEVRDLRATLNDQNRNGGPPEKIRFQWAGDRTRVEISGPFGMPPSVEFHDSRIGLYINTVRTAPDSQPQDTGVVYPQDFVGHTRPESVEGMATLLKGVPLRTALQNARFGQVQANDATTTLQILRTPPPMSMEDYNLPRGKALRGMAYLTVRTESAVIERIDVLQPQEKDNRSARVIASDYTVVHAATPDSVRMPRRVVATYYNEGRVTRIDEYHLVSAKFNEELPDGFLSGPVLSRPTQIMDYRNSERVMHYLAEGDLLRPEQARVLRFREVTRQMLPWAIGLQVPVIYFIVQRRRRITRAR